MTFFINAPEQPPTIKSNNPELDITNLVMGIGAAFSSAAIKNNANYMAQKQTNKSTNDLGRSVAERVGLDAMLDGQKFDAFNKAPESIDQGFQRQGIEWSQRAIKLAREDAELNPEKWADIDLSEEGIERSTNLRMQVELQDAQEVLDMMPTEGGRAVAEFLGEMAGVTLDIKNLPFLIFGVGAGSFRSIVGREAAINMAAEAAFLPSQFSQAERLDIPDPDIATQLAIAAGAGAVLGGSFYAAGRGLTLWKQRNKIRNNTSEYDNIELDGLVGRSEEILDSDIANPFDEIGKLHKVHPPILKSQEQGMLQPLLGQLAEENRINTDSDFAIALNDAGINAETAPGLFSSAGRSKFDDKLVADIRDVFPDIAKRIDADEVELDQGSFVQILSDQLNRREQAPSTKLEDTLEPNLTGNQNANLFIDTEAYQLDTSARAAADNIARDVNDWFDGHPQKYREVLTPDETREIITALQKNGGDAEYHVQRVIERKFEYTDNPNLSSDQYKAIQRDQRTPSFARNVDQTFDDIHSVEAQAVQDSVLNDLRIHANDLGELDLGDGAGVRSVAGILDELDREQEFIEVIALCGKVRR